MISSRFFFASYRWLALIALTLGMAACGSGGGSNGTSGQNNFTSSGGAGGGNIAKCQIFPSDNPWNRDVSLDPVDPNSDNYISHMNGHSTNLHPDFGSNPTYGIPYTTVTGTQALVAVTFDQSDESDPGPYPIPPNAPIEANSDAHVL